MKLQQPIFARIFHFVVGISHVPIVGDFVDILSCHLRYRLQQALSVNMERTGGLAVSLLTFWEPKICFPFFALHSLSS